MLPGKATSAAGFAVFLLAINTTDSFCQTSIGYVSPDAEKAVLARLAEIQSAAEALDPDSVFSFVMENDKGALVQNGEFFLTRGAALESTKLGYRDLQKVSFRFEQQHISLLSPGIALATGTGASSFTLKDGRALTAPFAQSVILVLDEGEWKVFHAHRSFPPQR